MSAAAASRECSTWLDEYAEFHRKHRYRPDAQYLVYTCRKLMPDVRNSENMRSQSCLGIGDRFRLIAFMVRVAAAYKRVLLIDWESPAPIERYFSPARIDWRLTAHESEDLTRRPLFRWSGPLQHEPPAQRYTRVFGNAQWFESIRLPNGRPLNDSMAVSLSCLWRFVFTPSARLRRIIAARQAAMFGTAGRAYNALHIRMGDAAIGVAFDQRTVPQKDKRYTHAAALHMIQCVKAQSALPIFVATDNAALKQAIRQGRVEELPLKQNASGQRAVDNVDVFDGVWTQGCVCDMRSGVNRIRSACVHSHAWM